MSTKRTKELARRKKLAERQKRREEFQERNEFPDFIFVESKDVPQEFVGLVKQAVKEIDFRDRTQFEEWEAEMYRDLRAGRPLPRFHTREAGGQLRECHRMNTHFDLNLGEQVYKRIPEAELRRFLPYHDARLWPWNRCIVVAFRSLLAAKGQGGTVYYSRHRPAITLGGRQLVVGFSRHAVERIHHRVTARPLSYAGQGDAFAVFDQCLDFEVVDLPTGQPGFTFWDMCSPGFGSARLAEQVLAERYEESAPFAHRAGYCPAVVEGGFFKATTFLYPGWRGTPEYALLRQAPLPAEQRREWVDLMEEMNYTRYLTESHPLLRWCHQRGLAQILPRRARFAPAVTLDELRAVMKK